MAKGINTTLDEGQTPIPVATALRGEGFDASEDGTGRGTPLVPVAFAQNQRGELRESDVSLQLTAGGGKPGEGYPAVRQGYAVRRLTPVECERLQGFPDGYTDVPYGRRNRTPDGPRY
jgi:DNA (cytosine-5)-methyltransferase 1